MLVGEARDGGLAADAHTIARHVDVVAVHRRPPRPGAWGKWPETLDVRLLRALEARDLPRPYVHQLRAIDATLAGRDVVVATPTASGKSLCFQVPIVHEALASPCARALLLFPTKALARDQVESFRGLLSRLPGGPPIGIDVYDGDVPPDRRRAVRARAHVVATNPDMLHRAMLPNHGGWASFLAGLQVVVLDELHAYRGLFGSHVANVLRRLWRVCEVHGARPRVVACSATIANPRELAEALSGRGDFELVAEDTAPAGPRTFVVLNPKVIDPVTGVRRSHVKVARVVSAALRRARVTTLVFCRTRKTVELLTRYLREDEVGAVRDDPAEGTLRRRAERRIRGYRGGYLPGRRREVEHALREGEAQVVVSTNALELGMDIGGLDAVVLAGYPGTRAATLQRAGRAGRRGAAALAVLVLSSQPLDQFIAAAPGFLFDRAPEHARIDPLNPEVLVPHLRCAAHELPFLEGDSVQGVAPEELQAALAYLADRGVLHRDRDREGRVRYLATGGGFPADDVDLRGTIEENFTVVEEAGPASEVLAEVDFEDGALYLHPGAIYPIEGATYEVRRLDWDARKGYVRRVDAPYYTEAVCKTRIRVVDPAPLHEPGSGVGYAHLVRAVPGFKKLRFRTHENIGFGPVHLPDLELHTTAAFWTLPHEVVAALADPLQRAAAALAAAHAIHHVAAMVLMCDVRDLGHAVTAGHEGAWAKVIDARRLADAETVLQASGVPTIHLYDNVPGGAGLSSQAHALGASFFDRVIAAVGGCSCERGCPTCLGAQAALPHGQVAAVDPERVLMVLHGLRSAVAR